VDSQGLGLGQGLELGLATVALGYSGPEPLAICITTKARPHISSDNLTSPTQSILSSLYRYIHLNPNANPMQPQECAKLLQRQYEFYPCLLTQ